MKRSTSSLLLLFCILQIGVFSGCNEEGKKKTSKHPRKVSQTAFQTAAAQGTADPVGPALNLEIGAGYNEQIANINNSLIAKSGVRWVRAYVNLSRNYWVFKDTFSPPPSPTPSPWPRSAITGLVEGNIIQQASNVSSDADTLAVAALDQLINAKTVFSGGAPVKVILSLKHDFSFPYPEGATVPPDQFPDLNTSSGLAEIQEMVTTIENLLLTNNRGNDIDILVTGNEPMFEIQPNSDPDTARKYKLYLNYLIQQLVDLKAVENTKTVAGVPNTWDFQIFVGALNSPIDPLPLNNVILPAVLEVARDNVNVAGIDLHEHVAATSEVHSDIQYVRDHTKLRPLGALPLQIISTEFSIIRLFEANMNNPVPPNSTLPPLWQFLNNTTAQAAAGTPISQAQFLNYFYTQSWYPKNWFREMVDAFEAEGVLAVTYGIEEAPRYPWSENQLVPTATPWVVNGVFNATLLGRSADGYPNTNPLVYPGFLNAITRMK